MSKSKKAAATPPPKPVEAWAVLQTDNTLHPMTHTSRAVASRAGFEDGDRPVKVVIAVASDAARACLLNWFKGRPPTTGFYWIKNDKTHRVMTHVGETARDTVWADETNRVRPNGFTLTEVYISPHTGRACALIHGERRSESEIGFDGLANEEWAGPLPVPRPEQWMGKDTSKDYSDQITRLPAQPAVPVEWPDDEPPFGGGTPVVGKVGKIKVRKMRTRRPHRAR